MQRRNTPFRQFGSAAPLGKALLTKHFVHNEHNASMLDSIEFLSL
jgi:hypothetical protein